MKTSYIALFLIALLGISPEASAQADDPLREGILAFRDGRYEDAARTFELVTERDPSNADAFFLLARLYTETPLKDRRKANRALDKALDLDPDNLTYLVGRLQQLREESWNFFVDKIRESKRLELAHKILGIDSTNAFAHEELGAAYIRDFWRYRNAIMLPSLEFGGSAYRMSDVGGTLSGSNDPVLAPSGQASANESAEAFPDFNPNEVFVADRFDIDRLDRLGVPIQDLSRRAHRAYARSIGHLQRALATDPRRRSVYDRMMEIYSLKGEYDESLEMLQQMYAFFPEDADTWLYLGLAHHRNGNLDAAAKSFETAFKYMSEEETAAFESLDYFLSGLEESRYAEDPVAYASRYWTSKDPRYLTPYNERKLEHYARLVYADLLYGSDGLDLRGWDTQRGRILVRYGVPAKDVVIIPRSTSGIQKFDPSQGYSEPGEAAIESRRQRGFKESAFDILDEANAFNIWDYGDFRFVFEDPFRNGEYRLYAPGADEIAAGTHPWINDYTIKARETFARIPELYEYEAPGRQIELPYLVNAFKGEGDDADLYVHYGVPIAQEGLGSQTINITANVGAFLISDQRDILVERRRTVYGLRGSQVRSFAEASLWVDTEIMKAPPGKHEVSMEFETASGSTVAVQRREVEVPDFAADRLAVSDVMLAYRVEEAQGNATGGDIFRRGLAISPAPWSVFAVEQPIYLYFEIYNLEKNGSDRTEYEMEAQLVPKGKSKGIAGFIKNIFGGTEGVAVSLPGSGTATDEGHYLILDAANQTGGLYTLRLRVRDNVSGRTVEREKELFLE